MWKGNMTADHIDDVVTAILLVAPSWKSTSLRMDGENTPKHRCSVLLTLHQVVRAKLEKIKANQPFTPYTCDWDSSKSNALNLLVQNHLLRPRPSTRTH